MAEATWYVAAEGGAATGPFDLARLKQMAAAGGLARGDLVYPAGGSEWATAATVPGLFAPPPPPRSSGLGIWPVCETCGWDLAAGRAGARDARGRAGSTDPGPVPDNRGYSAKLLGRTAVAWFLVGTCTGGAVDSTCLGIPLVLGVVASALGIGCVGLLALTRTSDKWYLLRWVNYVLERLATGAFLGGFAAALLLAVFAGMPVSGPDDRTAQQRTFQNLILRSSTLFGQLAALVVCLARTWDRLRHVDLPTDPDGNE